MLQERRFNCWFSPQVCSPAHLRQQSEDLYAVIDEVLEDPIPMVSFVLICTHLNQNGRDQMKCSLL